MVGGAVHVQDIAAAGDFPGGGGDRVTGRAAVEAEIGAEFLDGRRRVRELASIVGHPGEAEQQQVHAGGLTLLLRGGLRAEARPEIVALGRAPGDRETLAEREHGHAAERGIHQRRVGVGGERRGGVGGGSGGLILPGAGLQLAVAAQDRPVFLALRAQEGHQESLVGQVLQQGDIGGPQENRQGAVGVDIEEMVAAVDGEIGARRGFPQGVPDVADADVVGEIPGAQALADVDVAVAHDAAGVGDLRGAHLLAVGQDHHGILNHIRLAAGGAVKSGGAQEGVVLKGAGGRDVGAEALVGRGQRLVAADQQAGPVGAGGVAVGKLVIAVGAHELLGAVVAVPLLVADGPAAGEVGGEQDQIVLAVVLQVQGKLVLLGPAGQVAPEKPLPVVDVHLFQAHVGSDPSVQRPAVILPDEIPLVVAAVIARADESPRLDLRAGGEVDFVGTVGVEIPVVEIVADFGVGLERPADGVAALVGQAQDGFPFGRGKLGRGVHEIERQRRRAVAEGGEIEVPLGEILLQHPIFRGDHPDGVPVGEPVGERRGGLVEQVIAAGHLEAGNRVRVVQHGHGQLARHVGILRVDLRVAGDEKLAGGVEEFLVGVRESIAEIEIVVADLVVNGETGEGGEILSGDAPAVGLELVEILRGEPAEFLQEDEEGQLLRLGGSDPIVDGPGAAGVSGASADDAGVGGLHGRELELIGPGIGRTEMGLVGIGEQARVHGRATQGAGLQGGRGQPAQGILHQLIAVRGLAL